LILEAFAQYLHNNPSLPAGQALSAWLWDRLNAEPAKPVDQVIQLEIAIGRKPEQLSNRDLVFLPSEAIETFHKTYGITTAKEKDRFTLVFTGASESGKRLLSSLVEYSHSYEQHRWSKFVHNLKASDFH
jgi:hypothetical protein